MPELQREHYMANWWARAAMLAAAVFFGWVIAEGWTSTSGNVVIRTIIPAYGIWLYATLAALVNRRTLEATPDGLTLRNGPIPLGNGRKWIPREQIAFSYYVPVATVADSGDSVVLWYLTGIQTRAGRSVPLMGRFDRPDDAIAAARSIAVALGEAPDGTRVDARPVTTLPEDVTERRVVWRWVVVVLFAIAAGIAWELAHRGLT